MSLFLSKKSVYKSFSSSIISIIFIGVLILGIFVAVIFSPPNTFETATIVEIPKGSTLSQASNILLEQKIIRSKFWFKVLVVVQGGHKNVVAGDYYFDKPQNLGYVASRFIGGLFNQDLIKITIPEGYTNTQIATLLKKELPLFDENYFLKNAKHGYMFPDTYYFFRNISTQSVISRMLDVFDKKTEALRNESLSQDMDFDDVIKIASILEEEVQTVEDMKLVAGILKNRLKIGMLLQVDADMNTYKVKGLPGIPISNPGVASIEASINSTDNKYLYYLSDLKGKIYYAETFEGHQKNRQLYLNR